MSRDSIFRIAPITKPITAAAAMLLVERGRLGLDEPVAAFEPWTVRGPVRLGRSARLSRPMSPSPSRSAPCS
jgi:CubicO group peptidase (beta-lactamase class C family)